MMVNRYRVRLAEEEQQELRSLVSKGRAAAFKQTHARILLFCDENQADGTMKDEEIAQALNLPASVVHATSAPISYPVEPLGGTGWLPPRRWASA